MSKEKNTEKIDGENNITIERSRYISLKGAEFSLILLPILWQTLAVFTPLEPVSKYALGLLTTTAFFTSCTYQAVRLRSKSSILCAVILLFLVLFFLFLFLGQGLGLF